MQLLKKYNLYHLDYFSTIWALCLYISLITAFTVYCSNLCVSYTENGDFICFNGYHSKSMGHLDFGKRVA